MGTRLANLVSRIGKFLYFPARPHHKSRKRCSRSRSFLVESLEPRLVPVGMTLADVESVMAQAVTRASEISTESVIAVVDREGFVLGVWDVNGGTPPTDAEIAIAVSKAGTAAFLSSNQHAFTSRTAGFIIQPNFPPGVRNKPPGPLVGVGFSNLSFSDINKFKGPGSTIVFDDQPGLAIAAVPGTSLNGSPGGVPLYKDGELIGGVGVTGDGSEGFIRGRDIDERVARAGQIGFKPRHAIVGSHVFIDGIRLPYVRGRARLETVAPLGSIGSEVAPYSLTASPAPFPYPVEILGGLSGEVRQPITADPLLLDGDPSNDTINGELRLTEDEVRAIIALAADRARITRAGIRLPRGEVAAQVFITVVSNPNADGIAPTVLGTFRTPDATMFSWDVSVQKARTALFFSSSLVAGLFPPNLPTDLAFSTRTVGFLAQNHYPPGIANQPPGPFNGLQEIFSTAPPNPNLPNGITIFPGGFPIYRNGVLIAAIGISGDGVDQDDIIGASGLANFLAPDSIRADHFSFHDARLPYAKFPRNPSL